MSLWGDYRLPTDSAKNNRPSDFKKPGRLHDLKKKRTLKEIKNPTESFFSCTLQDFILGTLKDVLEEHRVLFKSEGFFRRVPGFEKSKDFSASYYCWRPSEVTNARAS